MTLKSTFILAIVSICSLGFGQEVPENVKNAIKEADAAVAAIVAIPDAQRTFDNTLGALDEINAKIEQETSLPIFMENVAVDPAERANARMADEYVSNWAITLGKREDLYKAIKAYAGTNPKLTGEQKRFLDFTMRDYRRAGMDLPPEERAKLLANEQEQNKDNIAFEQNIADDETTVPFALSELAGVPKDVLAKQQRTGDLYLLGMDEPTLDAVLNSCSNEETRHKYWVAFKRRGGIKNVQLLERLIKLRAEEAKMLGYKNAVDYVLETRMAKNSENVAKFYDNLRPIVRKKALLDMKEFTAAKRKETRNPKAVLMPWDYSYYKEELQKSKYAVDDEQIRQYFPMDAVVNGLFKITESLYGITYTDVTDKAASLHLPIWHPDVKLYEVTDNKTGEVLGHFYTDLYPREGKYTHAACWGLEGRRVMSDGTVHLPLAAMVTNFTKPGQGKPSLVLHDEVTTFFHEFGHCLHNILTQATMDRFSGTNVELDFVEAPSQMFENWTWDKDVLRSFTRNYKTGKPLPDKLLDGMLKARYLGSGLEAEHQFYYGLVDQAYHTSPGGVVDTTKVANDLYPKIELYPHIDGVYMQAGFGHLTNYESAYYGYMWSLVYAQDMFQRFKQLGLTNPKAGAYYREKILSRGGTEDAANMVRDYLGREPSMEPFLEELGLKEKK